MDDIERNQRLGIIGEAIRLSDLPDEDLMKFVVVDMLKGISDAKLNVNSVELAEMISLACVGLGGYHRHSGCKW